MGTREVVEQYFAAMNEGRAADMEKLKAPHSTYWISGEGSWPFGGDVCDEKFAQLWTLVQRQFVEGPTLVMQAIIADGQRAAVYIQVRALRKDGRMYDNQVVMLMTVVDSLITQQREFWTPSKSTSCSANRWTRSSPRWAGYVGGGYLVDYLIR